MLKEGFVCSLLLVFFVLSKRLPKIYINWKELIKLFSLFGLYILLYSVQNIQINESSDILPILFQVREFGVIYVMLCAIWYYLHNLKNVKITHVEVLLLVVFFTFFKL